MKPDFPATKGFPDFSTKYLRALPTVYKCCVLPTDHGSLLLIREELAVMIFWGFERSGVTKDRLLHHRMFGPWLSDLRFPPYIQRTLVPP